MKKAIAIVMASVLALSLSACGGAAKYKGPADFGRGIKEDGFCKGLSAQDYVTLPENYNAIPLDPDELVVTDAEVGSQFATLLNEYGTLNALG